MQNEMEEISAMIDRTCRAMEMTMSAIGKLQFGLKQLRDNERSLRAMLPIKPGSLEESLADLDLPQSRLVLRR